MMSEYLEADILRVSKFLDLKSCFGAFSVCDENLGPGGFGRRVVQKNTEHAMLFDPLPLQLTLAIDYLVDNCLVTSVS